MKKISILLFSLLLLLPWCTANSEDLFDQTVWYGQDEQGQSIIHLYFFWSKKCPHCLKAKPDIIKLVQDKPWINLHSLELSEHPENIKRFIAMSAALGQQANSVPTFMYCRNYTSGYDTMATSGIQLMNALQACRDFAMQRNPDNSTPFIAQPERHKQLKLPLLGEINADDFSLPALTIMLAGMDAFNPCAFFVLLFLLSMLTHANSQKKLLLIGSIFVFFSGAIYFLFMSAWLNLFLILGELRFMTMIAGLLAVLMALINIKDYFWFKKGLSLSMSDGAKPKLFERMRRLLKLDSLPTVIFATVLLAIVANSYELLCTAGFPMVYTRILTLNNLSEQQYYLYLLFYNVIYVLPLLVIVLVFSFRLGTRKLSEREGTILKLLSGMMMLLLGGLLLLAPGLLNNVLVASAILITAILATWVIAVLT
jgi:hypothetical protein